MSILLLEVSNAIVPNAMGIQNYVLQYGLLGVIAVVLAYIAFQQYQKLIERNDMLEDKIDRVQKEMNDLLIEERDRMRLTTFPGFLPLSRIKNKPLKQERGRKKEEKKTSTRT